MSTQTLGWLLFGIQSVVYVALCVVCPFRFVLRSGQFGRGVLLCWGTAILVTFCSTMFGQYLRTHVDKMLTDYCFDGQHVVGMLFGGWWQGLIVSGIALTIHRRRKRQRQKTEIVSHETTA